MIERPKKRSPTFSNPLACRTARRRGVPRHNISEQRHRQPPSAGADQHETVAAVRGVDGQRTEAGDLQLGVELVGERRDIAHRDSLRLPVAAFGRDLDEATGRFECKARLGLDHGHDPGVEQDRRHTDRIGPRHRRRVRRLHDDPAHPGSRILGRDEQVVVPEHSAARLVQHEIAQRFVLRDEARLLPDRVAGRRGDAADDDVAHFAFRVAAYDMNDRGRANGSDLVLWRRRVSGRR